MFQINHVLARQTLLLRCQKIIITALSITCLLLWWGWWQAPKHLTIYLPPDLGEGITQKATTIPKPFLYSFTAQVWQQIESWSDVKSNAQGDFPYKQHILQYQAYLSSHFKAQLLKDYHRLLKAGHLDRTRRLQLLAFQENQVKQLSENSWEVDLDVLLIERADNMIVKRVKIRYPLRVVRRDVNRHVNPYGLVVDGFIGRPERLIRKNLLRL